MIGVLTHHWARNDMLSQAAGLLDRNGDAQSGAQGFVSRQTLRSRSEPGKITSLVLWESEDIYEEWRASPQREAIMSGAAAFWSRPPESERFDVA